MNWKSRLKAIGAGTVLVAVGYFQVRAGIQVVTHWTGQPMFSFGLIAGGLILFASAAIPNRVISRLTDIKSARSKLAHDSAADQTRIAPGRLW
jgi:hypothetical protein